ncbi:hypothetical protein C8J56DRAFT_1073610 [Mycena floridula]|nr:hypothetical protein C8J56DRAFT_1073610 [Mycena floridula]
MTGEPVTPSGPRRRKTHISQALTHSFTLLSLADKLQENFHIEKANSACMAAHIQHLREPAEKDGSDVASMITIPDEELDMLTDPIIQARHLAYTLNFVLAWLAGVKREMQEEERARKDAAAARPSTDELMLAKRRNRSTENEVVRQVGIQKPVEIPQIIYDTDDHTPIPLPFFLNA